MLKYLDNSEGELRLMKDSLCPDLGTYLVQNLHNVSETEFRDGPLAIICVLKNN